MMISELFGISVAAITMDEVLPLVDAAVAERRPFQIGVVNAAKVVNMQRDPRLRGDVLASDIVLPDGMSLVWARRLVGRPRPAVEGFGAKGPVPGAQTVVFDRMPAT